MQEAITLSVQRITGSAIVEDALTITGNSLKFLWRAAFATGATKAETPNKLGNDSSFMMAGRSCIAMLRE
jgi:hypothetical protein